MIITQYRKGTAIPYDLLLEADPNRQFVNEHLEKGILFHAMGDNKIIGVYILMDINEKEAEVKNISVAPGYQKQGIGRQLLEHAVKQARKKGMKYLHIRTGNSSIGQLALYQKTGFRIETIEKDFFTNHYPEKIIENGIVCRDRIKLTYVL